MTFRSMSFSLFAVVLLLSATATPARGAGIEGKWLLKKISCSSKTAAKMKVGPFDADRIMLDVHGDRAEVTVTFAKGPDGALASCEVSALGSFSNASHLISIHDPKLVLSSSCSSFTKSVANAFYKQISDSFELQERYTLNQGSLSTFATESDDGRACPRNDVETDTFVRSI